MPTEAEIEAAIQAMRDTELDCEKWPQDVMAELARAALEAAERVRDAAGFAVVPKDRTYEAGFKACKDYALKTFDEVFKL